MCMDYFTNDTIKNYVANLRRYFHENPELSGEEINTTKRIKKS